MNIVLIGFKNSGKTSLGKMLARHLKVSFFDTDIILEDAMQMSCFEIHQKYGEPFFRDIETKTLQSLQKVKHSIIATGGGAVISNFNRKLLLEIGKVIYLSPPKELLFKRWQKGPASFIFSKKEFDSLYFKRKPLYRKIAYETIDLCDDFSHNLKQLLKFKFISYLKSVV